eukprot:1131480-Prymnesium_polylepis.1
MSTQLLLVFTKRSRRSPENSYSRIRNARRSRCRSFFVAKYFTHRSISKSISRSANTANTANTEVPRLDRFLY